MTIHGIVSNGTEFEWIENETIRQGEKLVPTLPDRLPGNLSQQ